MINKISHGGKYSLNTILISNNLISVNAIMEIDAGTITNSTEKMIINNNEILKGPRTENI